MAGNFALGGGAFVAGLLNGALESLWDTLVGFKDLAVLAWEIVESLFKGTILADAQGLWETISKLDIPQLVEAGIEDLAQKWNQPDLLKQWHFRGWLCGYAIAELVMLVFSEGILTAIKGAAKAGKLSEILAKFPKVAELVEKAKTLGGEKVERLRRRINEVLDDLGHNPNDDLATANGAPLPPNRIEGQTPQLNQPSRKGVEPIENRGGIDCCLCHSLSIICTILICASCGER